MDKHKGGRPTIYPDARIIIKKYEMWPSHDFNIDLPRFRIDSSLRPQRLAAKRSEKRFEMLTAPPLIFVLIQPNFNDKII